MTDFERLKSEYSMPDIAERAGVRLTRNGKEWQACCPFHGEKTPSFSIYQKLSGWRYMCFGCGAHGDNVDLVQELYQVDVNEAVKIITGDDTHEPAPRTTYVDAKDPYDGYQIIMPPEGAEPIKARVRTPPILNPKRIDPNTGKPKVITYEPKEVYAYKSKKGNLLGYVLRVEYDGRKITPGVWWTKGKDFEGWSHGRLPEPRVLYGMDLLAAEPTKQVLLVEGEKCADRANVVLGDLITAVTWPGGGKSIHKVRWRHLTGRSVVIWPDNDAEGLRTVFGWWDKDRWRKGLIEYLHEARAKRVKVVMITPSERPAGWDVADAIDKDGLNKHALQLLIKAQVELWSPERHAQWRREQGSDGKRMAISHGDGETEDNGSGDGAADITEHMVSGYSEPETEEDIGIGGRAELSIQTWRNHLILNKEGTGLKASSLQNIALMIQYEPRFAGIFAWNDFAKEVYLMRRPPWDLKKGDWYVRRISDTDVTAAAGWLEYYGLAPKRNDVGAVVSRVAEHNKFNPVIEGLEKLKWDGVPRINGGPGAPWLTYYMGADHTEINRLFGERWLIGAVARAYNPGCKMDNMLILEGAQGLKKSTSFRILADAIGQNLFTDEISNPGSKDAGQQMQGVWIIELSELDALRKSDISTLKAWLARSSDRFRRPYGKIVETFERGCVFAGTINPDGVGYLKDPTGDRRFWPVHAKSISLDALKQDAAQLWAEAKHLYQSGLKWWLEPDEEILAGFAQRERREEDPWAELIDRFLIGHTRVTIREIMDHLEIPKERRGSLHDSRVRRILHSKKWRIGEDRVFMRREEEVLL